MRIFRIFIPICLFCFSHLLVLGQPDSNLIPPSPNAASLGVYGQLPVGLFTGTVQFNIPIYTIKTKDIEVPISLGYSSNGIRVDELPSVVGTGWSLNAGGVITRSNNDELDDFNNRVVLPDVDISSPEMADSISDYITTSDSDMQPDIFGFNFCGYSGKFFLDKNLKAVLINPSPIKIEVYHGLDDFLDTLAFKITTPDGLIFYFGDNHIFETAYMVHHNVPGGSPHVNGPSKTAWYLTTIKLLNGDDILFDYDTISQYYQVGLSQSVKAKRHCETGLAGGCQTYPATHTLPQYTYTILTSRRLREISWPEGMISFAYSSMFTGYAIGSWGFTKLDSIKVYNIDNVPIKKTKFDYKIFTSDLSYKNNDLHIYDSNIVNRARLFLEKVIDNTGNDGAINPYIFEYYYPWKMAPRLSYSQDYWGFFNGKHNTDFVSNDMTYYNAQSYSDPAFSIDYLFFQIHGDKNPDWEYGINGLLKKIIYPTMGSTTLQYEPHSVRAVGHLYPNPIDINLDVNSDSTRPAFEIDTCSTGVIHSLQEHVPVYFSVQYVAGCSDTIDGHDNLYVTCRDAETNQPVHFHYFCRPLGRYEDIPEEAIIATTSTTPYAGNCFIRLEEDRSYIFEIRVNSPCLSGALSLRYYRDPIKDIMINKQVGGLRISKIENNDAVQKENIIKYYYAYIDSLDCSSGEMENLKPAISFVTSSSVSFNGNNQFIENLDSYAILSSGSLNPIYNSSGNYISYKSVVEGFGENSEGGAIAHHFNLEFETVPCQYGDLIPGTPFGNVFNNGFESKQIQYIKNANGQFIPIRKQENQNFHDNRLDTLWQGFNGSLRETQYATYVKSYYNINTYDLNSQWHYVSQTTQNNYDENGNNPITKVTNYFYDNEKHMQLSREMTIDSKGDTILIKKYYPDDITGTNALPGGSLTTMEYAAIDSMKTENRHIISQPVQIESYKNSEKLSTKRINYKFWGNLIMPESIESSTGNSPLKKDLIYYQYDEKGNPTELGKPNGSHVAYLWGYNYSLPILKVENATFQEVIDATGEDYEQLQTFSNNELNDIGSTVRDLLSGDTKLVYSYTYDPLVGMVNEINPTGIITSNTYDDYRRLTSILDSDSNIIKHIEYNYKKYILCSPSDFSFQYTGGLDTIEVITNLNNAVTVHSSGSWYSIEQTGQNNIYTITCEENTTYDVRNSEFTLICDSISFTCPVTQSCAPFLMVDPTVVNFEEVADSIQIAITTNKHWFAYATVPWLVIGPSQSGENSGNFKIYCAENTSIQPRETNVNISAGGIADSIIVSQEGIDYLNVEPLLLEISHGQSLDTIHVNSNLAWEAVVDYGDWISITHIEDNYFVVRSEHNLGDERDGSIVVNAGIFQKFITIIQASSENE